MRPKKLGQKSFQPRAIGTNPTISDFPMSGQSARFGTLIDTQSGDRLPISFARDTSLIGVYNVVLKSPDGKRSQRIRMTLEGRQPLKEAEKFVLDYFNTDSPVRFEFERLDRKRIEDKPLSNPKATGHPADVRLKQRLAELKKIQFKTFGQEREITHLKQLIKADPNKFKPGEGVAWKLYNQTNRGFRVLQVFPERKEAVIGLVKDTGFADINAGHREVVHVGDLMRDRKYDA